MNAADLSLEKAKMRAALKAVLNNQDGAAFSEAGDAAAARLRGLQAWRDSRTVCVFLPMKREIDTRAIIQAAVSEGKVLCFPRIEGVLISFRHSAPEGPWAEGVFGIREPVPNAPVADFSILPGRILVIVPGLAFDAEGMRLGRGKGYYDRFLSGLRSLRADTTAIGIGLRSQMVDSVPSGDFDQRLDAVILG